MRNLDIGCLVVMENDQPRGMVTDRDITCRALCTGLDQSDLTIADVMSHDVVWCTEDGDIEDAVRLMEAYQIRRLPVMTHGGDKLVGMLSAGDVLTRVSRQLAGELASRICMDNQPLVTARSLR